VIVEPIQGEGGVNALTKEFAAALRQRTKEVGALLIYDEIQSGLGRTGDLWAHQYFGADAQPDILTMAKALGNGYPIGATMVTEEVEQALKVGDHGTTYGGNPLGARIGHYVVEQLSSPELLRDVQEKSQLFQNRFQQWQSKFGSTVIEHRGRGLLLGLQLSKDPSKILARAQEDGLLVITCGVNTIRFVPALNIPDKLIVDGLDILEGAIASLE
jgi:acetylornithine aminotransferase